MFGAFPRTGIPRHHASYEDWVQTVDVLLRCGAFPEPTFLWWDVRPQPKLGTVEMRIMDVQSTVGAHGGARRASSSALAHLEIEEGAREGAACSDEVLAENRFLATRDGIDAWLLDPDSGSRRPARAVLTSVLDAVRPHAQDAGAERYLDELEHGEPGYSRQRAVAAAGGGPGAVEADLTARFRPV